MEILILFSYYFLIIFSIIGFGNLSSIIFQKSYSISELGFRGLLCLIIISYITNFIIEHSYFHNLILLLIGLISFVNLILNKSLEKKFLILTIIIFTILFLGLLMYKNHDDFFYYHFPYTLSLISEKKIIGIGLLEHGFRTPSSLFYLNSLFYLPIIDYYLINAGAIFIMGFCNIFFLEKIFFYLNKKKTDLILFLSLFSLILVNTAFYRIAEHGTDRSALILILVFVINYLESLKVHHKFVLKNFKNYYEKLIILLLIIISLKSFYIIYLIIFLAWFLHFYLINQKLFIIKNILIYKSTYLFIVGIFIFILTVFLNTGCLIYPASFTCFPSVEWGISIEEVDRMKNWYSLWSKAGANPNFRVENSQLYLSNFNWIQNWFTTYFFTKVTDFLLVILMISIFGYFLLKNKNTKKVIKTNYRILYFLIIFLTIEWFINHPALRYGGYTLIALLIFIPLSNYLYSHSVYSEIFKKRFILLIVLSFGVFVSKNIVRINQEIIKYGYEPFENPYYFISEDGFYFEKRIIELNNINNKKDKKYYLILNQDLINSKN